MLVIALAFAMVFGLLFAYTQLYVDFAMLSRKIRIADIRREELVKRNEALKSAIAEVHPQSMWNSFNALPLLEQNQIIRIELPPPPGE